MAKILRQSDRISLTIGDVKFKIAPLSYEQKKEVANCTYYKDGQSRYDVMGAQSLLLKYGLKEVDGIEDLSGEKYELEFDENNILTDECLSEIFNLDQRSKLMESFWILFNGMPSENVLKDENGNVVEGVEIEVAPGKGQ